MARKDPLAHLHRFPDGAPGRLRDEILALGPAALPGLLALVQADGAATPGTPAHAAAINAASLYGRLGQADALPVLLDLVAIAPLDGPLQAAAMFGVLAIDDRDAVTDAILARTFSDEREPYALELLARAGRRDPAVAARIVAMLDRFPRLGAQLASAYADPALLPALRATFDGLSFPTRMGELDAETAILVLESIFVLAGSDTEDRGRQGRLRAALQISIEGHGEDLARR
jgi:hypothetical protein